MGNRGAVAVSIHQQQINKLWQYYLKQISQILSDKCPNSIIIKTRSVDSMGIQN